MPDPSSPREILDELDRIRAENARLLEHLGEGQRRFRLVSRGVFRVQEQERGRISRDLHDGLGQSLTALKLRLERLERSPAAEIGEHLRESRELADRCLQECRQISHQIRPQILDELGLVPTLRWLARGFGKHSGLEVAFVFEGDSETDSDPDAETLAFRVAQEALTNAAKHAGTKSAELRLLRNPGHLVLLVSDEGAGFDAAAAFAREDEEGGFGLRGMRDRVQLLGGRFALHSAPGAGTQVRVELPLETQPVPS